MRVEPRTFLRLLYDGAVEAADPATLLPPSSMPHRPRGRTVVVGAGKAAARMAAAVERGWQGPLEGIVITRYGHGEPCESVEVVEAAHPLPDSAGIDATMRILELVRGLTGDDLVLCLLSGGGSALLELPAPGIALHETQAVGRALLRSGASIAEINCVRKHLSLVKGGRLAEAAHPARVITYIISDVPGDDPSTVASGPTTPDPTTFEDAATTLARYGIVGPASVVQYLQAGMDTRGDGCTAEAVCETPKPGSPSFAGDQVEVLATARDAIEAAARIAQAQGVTPVILGFDLEGEARALGREHARLAIECASGAGPASPPCVLLSGGETTVTVAREGRGGRNSEYLLGLALGLQGADGISALAGDTDGIDGTEDNAGAFVVPDTLVRAAAAGLEPDVALLTNDAYGFFEALDDLLVVGPTRTNVNDFRAILVEDCR